MMWLQNRLTSVFSKFYIEETRRSRDKLGKKHIVGNIIELLKYPTTMCPVRTRNGKKGGGGRGKKSI